MYIFGFSFLSHLGKKPFSTCEISIGMQSEELFNILGCSLIWVEAEDKNAKKIKNKKLGHESAIVLEIHVLDWFYPKLSPLLKKVMT